MDLRKLRSFDYVMSYSLTDSNQSGIRWMLEAADWGNMGPELARTRRAHLLGPQPRPPHRGRRSGRLGGCERHQPAVSGATIPSGYD